MYTCMCNLHVSFIFLPISTIHLVDIHILSFIHIKCSYMIVVHCQSALWSDPPGKHCDVDVTYILNFIDPT